MGKKVGLEDRYCYYGVLLGLLYSIGTHQAYVKMGVNDEEGVYPVQKVMNEYGIAGKIDEEIRISGKVQDASLEILNKWSQKVGFKPIRETDFPRYVKFLESEPRREYIRTRVQKCFRTGEVLSIADLVQLRLDVEHKKARKEGGDKNG